MLEREAKTGSVELVIGAKSVHTGVKLLNGLIYGEDFFHTKKCPSITFNSSKLNFNRAKLTSVDGDLTDKGITKPRPWT